MIYFSIAPKHSFERLKFKVQLTYCRLELIADHNPAGDRYCYPRDITMYLQQMS